LHILIGLASALLSSQPGVAQTVSKRLAVLEFNGGGIKGEVLDAFSDEVRGGAVDALAGRVAAALGASGVLPACCLRMVRLMRLRGMSTSSTVTSTRCWTLTTSAA